MKTATSAYFAMYGALVWLAGASAPLDAAAKQTVAEMNPAELRALFHQPEFSVPDGLGDYNEDYRSTAPAEHEGRNAGISTVAESNIDYSAVCTTLKEALDYPRSRAAASRRVSFEPDSLIVRWYNASCTQGDLVDKPSASGASVDPAELKALRRYVSRNPEAPMNDY